MGINPIPVAAACTLAYSVQALILGTGSVDVSFPNFDQSQPGFLGFLVAAFDVAGEAVVFAGQFLAFSLIGLPWYVGVPLAVVCTGTIAWAVLQLIRGV